MSALLGALPRMRMRPGAIRRIVPGARRALRRLPVTGLRPVRRRVRRARGVTASGIRGARKLLNLLRDFQAALPRGRARVAPRRRRTAFGRRRFGDPEEEFEE